MATKLETSNRNTSWSTPTEEDIRAWEALPRDEQLARMRVLLDSDACNELSEASFEEIIAAARRQAKSATNV